jgi:hypothetical protein
MDPIVFRGIERLLIVAGGIVFGYLGYRLFEKGLTAGEGNLKFESKALKIIFSGTGPGLFFMAFGAVILVVALWIGGVSIKETSTSSARTADLPDNKQTANEPLVKATEEASPAAIPLTPASQAMTHEREVEPKASTSSAATAGQQDFADRQALVAAQKKIVELTNQNAALVRTIKQERQVEMKK